MIAANNGWVECLKLLLKVGADIEAKARTGFTALILAAQKVHADC